MDFMIEEATDTPSVTLEDLGTARARLQLKVLDLLDVQRELRISGDARTGDDLDMLIEQGRRSIDMIDRKVEAMLQH